MKNKENDISYVRQWVKNNQRYYQMIVEKCKFDALNYNNTKKVSIKGVIYFMRDKVNDFKFPDGATRFLREYIEIANPELDGKFSKVK